MNPAHSISTEVIRIISSSPSKRVMGAHLSAALKVAFPTFLPSEHGCLNLRAFLRKYVPQIKEIGRSGADVVYGLAGDQQAAADVPSSGVNQSHVRHVRLDDDVWKTFASPWSRFRLFGNKETGDFKVVGQSDPAPPSPWLEVSPCPPEKHLLFAREFADSLGETQAKDRLIQTLSLPRWWNAFFQVAQQNGLRQKWSAHRSKRILDEFVGSLKSLEIPFRPGQVRGLGSRETYLSRTLRVSASGTRVMVPLLRRLAMAAVEKMTDEELRALRLPLGYVVDEFERQG